MNVYEWADRSVNSCPRYATGFTQRLAAGPYVVSPVVRRLYESRLSIIRTFQEISLEIFRSAVSSGTDPAILHWLLNDTPSNLGMSYHRDLEDRHYTLPVFFRTDEAVPGMIIEIQCPGSLWGELQLTFDYVAEFNELAIGLSPADQFAEQLAALLGETPIVHHMLDNASVPAGMRYFIEKTRPAVKYWAIDYDIRPDSCNFIRSHSFFGLCAENNFRTRLAKAGKGVTYDLPPHVLFDQKASLVLPFWSLTRHSFSDELRSLFLFSTPLLPIGIELPDDARVTIEEFSRWPRSKRSYYLKYAGSNVELNWGAKAVYRLSNYSSDACLKLLRHCLAGYENGQTWLLQKEDAQDDEIIYWDRDGTTKTEKLRAKFSAFYGPVGCMGVMVTHRHFYKVHGQPDAVTSYVVAGSREGDANTDTNRLNWGGSQ